MDDQDFSAVADLIDGDEIPMRCIRIVEYLNDDGDVGTNWEIGGKPTTREVLAMLEIARLQVGAAVVVAQMED